MNALLANEIACMPGYEVSMLSFFKTAVEPKYNLHPNIGVDNLFEQIFSIKRHLPSVWIKLRMALRKINPDILVCSMPGLSIFIEPIKGGTKTIYWLHQSFFLGRKFGLDWIGNRVAVKYGDAMVVLTKEALAEIGNFHGNARIEQIYNPYVMVPSPHAYDINSKKIISCGRFTPQKGFDMLVDVAEKVLKKHPDWTWDIYGDGSAKSELVSKIKLKGLSDRVLLKGFSSQLEDIYRNCSIYALTSRYEGFGLVLIEAMSQRLPCVAFNCKCGPSEIINDGKNGFLIECFDIDKMAKKINLLIENDRLRADFSRQASVINGDFSKELFLKKWNRLFADFAPEKE